MVYSMWPWHVQCLHLTWTTTAFDKALRKHPLRSFWYAQCNIMMFYRSSHPWIYLHLPCLGCLCGNNAKVKCFKGLVVLDSCESSVPVYMDAFISPEGSKSKAECFGFFTYLSWKYAMFSFQVEQSIQNTKGVMTVVVFLLPVCHKLLKKVKGWKKKVSFCTMRLLSKWHEYCTYSTSKNLKPSMVCF